jgi:hypothetical protein
MTNNISMDYFIGKTIVSYSQSDDVLTFTLSNKEIIHMYHQQDCCESVYIESIMGDLVDLLNSPILLAECVSEWDDSADASTEWTFYKLVTIKGSVTIRWLGTSNGYYSTSVDIIKETI